ncbi:MAG: hypothetical protein Q9224_006365, partial [Gallowayella concinna]
MIVRGGGKEQEEGKVLWPHWTVSGVDKFLEWLYIGDYKCPYPVKARNSEHGANDEDEEISPPRAKHGNEAQSPLQYDNADADLLLEESEIDQPPVFGWGQPVLEQVLEPVLEPSTPIINESPAVASVTSLQDLSWSGSRPLGKLSQAEEFEKWTGHQLWRPDQLDYKATFQTHAELYQMGCYYLLDELKNMAWQRLRLVLISIGTPTVGSRVVANLVELIHYAYRVTSDACNEEEPLRKLVTTVAALHFTRFKGAEIEELIASPTKLDREFVSDLMAKMMQKMEESERGSTMQTQ